MYGGINFQHDTFVYGIEAAWSWLDGTVTSFPDAQARRFPASKLRDYGSVKARAGLAFGSTLRLCRQPVQPGAVPQFSIGSPSEVGPAPEARIVWAWPLPRALSICSVRIGFLRGQVEYAQFQTQRITSNFEDRFGQETFCPHRHAGPVLQVWRSIAPLAGASDTHAARAPVRRGSLYIPDTLSAWTSKPKSDSGFIVSTLFWRSCGTNNAR